MTPEQQEEIRANVWEWWNEKPVAGAGGKFHNPIHI